MIKTGISAKKCNKNKQILHGILIGSHGSGFLSWELVKFTKLGHQLVSIYFSSSGSGMTANDPASKKIFYIKDYSRFCRGFSTVKKVSVEGSISQESLIKRVLKRLAKHCENMTVIVGTDQENTLGSWVSCARFCTDWLSGTTAIIVSTRSSILQLRGFRLNPRPEFDFDKKSTSLGYAEEVVVGKSESEVILISEDALRDGSEESSGHSFDRNHEFEEENSLTSISLIRKELPESALGWPLRRRQRTRNRSVVEWVMSLSRNNSVDCNETNTSPGREIDNLSVLADHHNIERRICAAEDESTEDSQTLEDSSGSKVEEVVFSSSTLPSLARMLSQPKLGWPLLRITVPESQEPSREFPKESNLFHKLISSNCKQFSYAELERATGQFSSENLIGEGGCSNVYKGCLSDGKLVAVKVLKSYKEAWSDFCLEADITLSLEHKNITPLVGVCMEDNILVLVYDFQPKGSLDEVLHGQEGTQLPWQVRFKAAVAIADALNYLHSECSKPVIHRDVKSSNILLSNELEPQLSDFGLAIWVPADSSYAIHEDVAGTFGYIAPEYFMRGRLSDKIDVYSYGVVLLELISGRKPITSKNLEVQESLIKWATPLLKTGDVEALLDPNLVDDYYESDQMQRMVLVANLCINQPARLRPKANQILRLLTGEDDGKEYGVKGSCNQEEEDEDLEFDDVKPRLDLSLSFLYTDVDAVSRSSVGAGNREQKQRLKLKDYLKQQHD
ncbi:hypothetical protein Ddye_007293 [Dipteronia dyeriana]|uniref:Protein kinase domain-containing protein n=1 Tax=Dipteronia dyeriana TaxID=168575 RepID=A0AAE0CRB8_9ROSI|nr:hypothetical protein Ddye_007293 [Dipteronia dyeriana]